MLNRKIFFWEDIIGPDFILNNDAYQTVLQKFRDGEYKAINLSQKRIISKKISSAHNKNDQIKIYSMYIDNKRRLLGTSIKINGKNYFYILEELLNHKYHTAKCLQANIAYAQLNSIGCQEIIADYFKKKEQCTQVSVTNIIHQSTYEVCYAPIEYINEQFLEFNAIQSQVFYGTNKTICLGAPGSGKSILAISKIEQALQGGYGTENQSVYYVTQSASLVEEMKEIWKKSLIAADPYYQKRSIHFVTYQDLIQQYYPDYTLSNDKDCQTWLAQSIINYPKLIEKDGKSTLIDDILNKSISPEKMYAEFRILSGLTSLDEYQHIGKRNSSLTCPRQKAWVWNKYKEYIQSLESKKLMYAPFKILPVHFKPDFLIVDEMQDFSLLQLASLCQCMRENFIFFWG